MDEGRKRVGTELKWRCRTPKHKCLTRKDKAAMILGFSSVCEGLFTHTEMATVAGSVPSVWRSKRRSKRRPRGRVELAEPFWRAGCGALGYAARRSSWKIGINHTSRTGPVRCILRSEE